MTRHSVKYNTFGNRTKKGVGGALPPTASHTSSMGSEHYCRPIPWCVWLKKMNWKHGAPQPPGRVYGHTESRKPDRGVWLGN